MRSVRSARKWDVVIHAPLAGALYSTDRSGWAGGAELQAYYLAHALADRGLRVAHIVLEDSTLEQHHDGVDLVFQRPRTSGVQGTRSVRAIWEALALTDAAVYVQRSASAATGIVGCFARTKGRRFVYSLSSGADLDWRLLPSVEAAAMRLGLFLADRVVTQTAEQQGVAVRRLGSKATLVRSFCAPLALSVTPQSFLWVGGIIPYKGPLAYLDLAERVPEATFVMVATPRSGWEQLAKEVDERVRRLPNVLLLRPRPRNDLHALYGNAVALVGTSTFEGFPNTFMEAWACGVPTLSLSVDPDGVIARYGLGAVAGGSVEHLAQLARLYWAGRGVDGATAKDYVRREHDPAVIGDAWTKLIIDLMQQGASKPRC
jgi:glycosyltransferase involved in cell wall biosynthesis